jgi:hypothetical protein
MEAIEAIYEIAEAITVGDPTDLRLEVWPGNDEDGNTVWHAAVIDEAAGKAVTENGSTWSATMHPSPTVAISLLLGVLRAIADEQRSGLDELLKRTATE